MCLLESQMKLFLPDDAVLVPKYVAPFFSGDIPIEQQLLIIDMCNKANTEGEEYLFDNCQDVLDGEMSKDEFINIAIGDVELECILDGDGEIWLPDNLYLDGQGRQ